MAKVGERGLRQDEAGTWWQYFHDGRRTRAKEYRCERCNEPVWSWRPSRRYCSERCRVLGLYGPQRNAQTCIGCGRSFFARKNVQRFCSHGCAATSMHASRPITTEDVGASELVNASNPYFAQDADGQWWYHAANGRTRAFIKVCLKCQRRFLTSVFHQRNQGHCSRACGIQSAYEARPKARGEQTKAWKGGRQIQRGYVWVWCPDHPTRVGKVRPYMLEHRLVMEQILGRYLLPRE